MIIISINLLVKKQEAMHPQEIDSAGPYRLLYCSGKGDKAGVIQELEKGVVPNLADYDKRTALHLASSEGCKDIVLLLLDKGADVNSVDRWGRTVSSIISISLSHQMHLHTTSSSLFA